MLVHILGLDNPSGEWYLFWSGIGGIFIPYLLTIPVVLWHLQCHYDRCFRIGHPYAHGRFCKKHKGGTL